MRRLALAAALAAAASSPAEAGLVYWTDWTAGTAGTNGSATGTLNVNGTPVAVSYSGEIAFIQVGNPAEGNYWNPSAPYVSPTVPNAPPGTDIIALSRATTRTVTFSEAITDPLFAVVSLNGNGYRFDRDFEIISTGARYWGNGTLTKANPAPGVYQLNGTGEPHGVIQFKGTFTSITWNSLTNENWNGFTVGVAGLAPPPATAVPEPSSMALLGVGTVGVAALRRRLSGRAARTA